MNKLANKFIKSEVTQALKKSQSFCALDVSLNNHKLDQKHLSVMRQKKNKIK